MSTDAYFFRQIQPACSPLSETQACAPDLVLYKGENIPRWQPGEPRRIELSRHRLPDLVEEIADTTLSLELDEHKQLYASLEIPEYWVIDVKGMRLFAFGLTAMGLYEPIQVSQVLTGLPIALVEQTLVSVGDGNEYGGGELVDATVTNQVFNRQYRVKL